MNLIVFKLIFSKTKVEEKQRPKWKLIFENFLRE